MWIIISYFDYGSTLKFWTGSGWSSEFPDAIQLPYREAYAKVRSWFPGKSYLVQNYGEDNEKRIEPNSFQGI